MPGWAETVWVGNVWASFRAEMLVLRRSPAAWGLVAVMPVYLLVVAYGVGLWSNAVPGLQSGLAMLLPLQSVIQATERFAFYGVAPFVVLGALMAGNDWQQGTIATAVTQRPGRLAAFLGQVLAMIAACVVSVLATFAVSTLVSLVVRVAAGAAADPVNAALPSAAVFARGIAYSVLISVTYGALGIMLGTLLRSAAAAVAAALIWSVILDPMIYQIGIYAGGWMLAISNLFPQASAITLNSTFGAPGGGPNTQVYLPVPPTVAVLVLCGYLIGFLAVSYSVMAIRDIGPAPAGRRLIVQFRTPGNRSSILSQEAMRPSHGGGPRHRSSSRQRPGILASYLAELAVFAKWPTVWALALLPTATTLLGAYLLPYVLFRHAGHGAIVLASPATALLSMLPGEFVAASLNGLSSAAYVSGTAAFFLLGAIVTGRAWSDRTLVTALLQGPSRVATALGQALAVASVLICSILIMFAAAAAASEAITATAHFPGLNVSTALPSPDAIASGLASALLVALAWAALGMLLGALFRNATGPAAILLFWTVFLQLPLDNVASGLTGVLRNLYDLLPDAGTNTLTGMFGYADSTATSVLAVMAPAGAITLLVLYAIAGFGIPVVLTRRRDIT
jgi:ABC-2 type transport system permease protein